MPASGGAPATFTSLGQGVWQPTGPTTAAITLVHLETDVQGHFRDTLTANLQVTLGADGNAWTGAFTVTVADPAGKVLGRGGGTLQATRITLPPVATPGAGTPTALTRDCALAGTHLAHAARPSLAGADLVGCDLRGSDLRFANLRGANLAGANLAGANLAGANLAGANLGHADLSGANLRDADLFTADLTGTQLAGVRWGNTTCPDGSNSTNDGGTCLAT